ncbi:hypothetical protein ABZW32_16615 [Streptomyces sp. NPDC004667]|uniref:hypothetical protein n=1 Tax=Streptomyces sp. NPDC004667 TaxID=3154285 RepID=UPI0033B25C70
MSLLLPPLRIPSAKAKQAAKARERASAWRERALGSDYDLMSAVEPLTSTPPRASR